MKIGLFYGPKGGSTEKAAQKIAETFGSSLVDIYFVNKATPADLDKYDLFILGTATVGNDAWDGKHPRNGWDVFFPHLLKHDFKGKKVALFGLGNQVMYPGHFVDAMGVFYKELSKLGATIVGKCSQEGYSFQDSEAHVGGQFVGLPLDEDTQPELTEARINNWVANLKTEFSI
jgi:flavodoxin I